MKFDKNILKDIFVGAYALVKNPDTFTTEYVARDVHGGCVGSNDPEACCWCSQGAISKVSFNHPIVGAEPLAYQYYVEFSAQFAYFIDHNYPELSPGQRTTVPFMNDTLPHPEVVKVWERFGQNQGYL